MDELEKYRLKVDEIDKGLEKLLERRFDLVSKIIQYKNENDLPIEDLEREEEIKSGYDGILSREFINEFYSLLFKEAKNEKHYN